MGEEIKRLKTDATWKTVRTVRSPGFMNMFFQTSAETVGITKNGAITRMRTMPRPHIS